MSSSLSFVKEDIQPLKQSHGLLGVELAVPAAASGGSASPSASASGLASGTAPGRGGYTSTASWHAQAYTVAQVVAAVIARMVADSAPAAAAASSAPGSPTALALAAASNPANYALMVADDEGHVDLDFPEADSSIPITSIGVDKFVLCERATDRTVVRLSIPQAQVALRAAERAAGAQSPSLEVSCAPPVGAHGGRTFVVTLAGGGGGHGGGTLSSSSSSSSVPSADGSVPR